ncbi:MAG: ketopantoate reductase family protein, partial [Chloroflexota bacterium]
MTLTIVGAGAIGGTVGAYLARAGEPVRLVDQDAAHVAAMRAHGLTIRGFAETFTVPVDAAVPEELAGPLDTVLLAVKAQHTEQALKMIVPMLTPNSAVVSLQNGLCERTIAGMIGAERTVGGFVNFSADYIEPGVIAYGGPGSLYLGELNGRKSARVQALRQVLSSWGAVTITANIWGYLWGKMGYANMLFATALADQTMADVIDRYRPLMVELAAEIYAVAACEAVRVEPFDNVEPSAFYPRQNRRAAVIGPSFDQLVARRRRDLKTKSGVWRDLAVRRRKTEADQQIGLAAEIGAGHG